MPVRHDLLVGNGSTATNFHLPQVGFLEGYYDYFNRNAEATIGDASGPITYVGNYGVSVTDTGILNASDRSIDLSVSAPLALLSQFSSQQMTVDPNETLLQVQLIAIVAELNEVGSLLSASGDSQSDEEASQIANALTILHRAQADANALQASVLSAIAVEPSSQLSANQLDAEVARLYESLSELDVAVGALTVLVPIEEQSGLDPTGQQRVADDLDGNGNSRVTRVLADIDGDGIVESDEVVAIINNFGDLHEFNVFYDTVSVSASESFTSLELTKQHLFFADIGINTADTGWRFEAYHDDWSLAVGDEVQGLWRLSDERLGSLRHHWLRDALADTRFSPYGTIGLRSVLYDRDFAFEGTGSILGRTAVDQSIDHYLVGPQLGLGVVAESSMFRFEAVAMGVLGYGRIEARQAGIFGEEAIPGSLNRSAVARATVSPNYRSDEEHLAWHGETRLTGSCQLTQRLRFDATWRWYVTGPVYDPAEAIVWDAPSFGYQLGGRDEAYGSDWFFGLTYTH